jgi:16S rRNA (adenine1518-N6/adenine1519-N6)-dimethyltransferase
LQAFYDVEYLFTVSETVFDPPPKVKSAVIRLVRKEKNILNCNEKLLFQIVKATFNHRRKIIRNTLKSVVGELDKNIENELLLKRPEQLGVEDFNDLTNFAEKMSLKNDMEGEIAK